MLPYFTYTEDIQNFCQLMGYNIDLPNFQFEYVCTYSMDDVTTPLITSYNLSLTSSPLIPPEKVLEYLTLILNGYSLEKAVEELNVVG